MKALQLTVLELFIEATSFPVTLLMATCFAEVSFHWTAENGWDHCYNCSYILGELSNGYPLVWPRGKLMSSTF